MRLQRLQDWTGRGGAVWGDVASEARWTLSDGRTANPLRMLNSHPDTHPLDCVTSAVEWLDDWLDDNAEML